MSRWPPGRKALAVSLSLLLLGVLASGRAWGDGTATIYPTKDAQIYAGDPNRNYGSDQDMRAGRISSGWEYYSLVHFNLAGDIPPDADILSADLQMTCYYYESSYAAPYVPCFIFVDWLENGVTWNTTYQAVSSPVAGAAYFGGPTVAQWDVTTMVNAWHHGQDNFGMAIRRDPSYGNPFTYYAIFRSREYSNQGNRPVLTVTYNSPPNCPNAGFSPASAAVVADATPTIQWNAATDPDNSAAELHYVMEIADNDSFTGSSTYTSEDGTCSVTIPGGSALADGGHYYYRVKTVDPRDRESGWCATQDFWVRIPPAVASDTLVAPNGGENWTGGTTLSITWTPGKITDDNLASSPITLEYSSNGGADWTIIATGEANDGTYSWAIPIVHSSNCKVRITATNQAANSASDISDGVFSIYSMPEVTSVSPSQGRDDLSTLVTIDGARFGGATEVELNTTPATQLTGTIQVDGGGTQITGVSVPSGVTPGVYDAIVTTPVGSNSSSVQKFTVYSHVPPIVESFTPTEEPNNQDSPITITGQHFLAATGVRLDDAAPTALTGVSVDSAAQITATVPAGVAPGLYSVIVTTPSGSNESSDWKFRAYDVGPHALTVRSTPVTGVSITGTHPDSTDYTTNVAGRSRVTLTAPWTASGHYFVQWQDAQGATYSELPSVTFWFWDETLLIAEYSDRPMRYYVNDASTANDHWCTAVGDDANDGLTADTPKATVQSVLFTYDLEPGDIVRIDTGTYNLSSNIEVSSNDEGSSSGDVTFLGSPHGSGSTFNRGSTAAGTRCFQIERASYVRVERLRCTGAWSGVWFQGAGGDYNKLVNCVVYGNEFGVSSAYGTNALIENCTVTGNGSTGVSFVGADDSTLKNTIVWADGADACAVSSDDASFVGDYNDLYATNGADVGSYGSVAVACPTLADWRAATGNDTHSLSVDPRFRDAATHNYRLKSTAEGDAESGLCVDAGDPGDSVGDEPPPNGGRVNAGAFGGTCLASRTPSDRALVVLTPNGHENLGGTVTVLWDVRGTDWQAGDQVKLEYSEYGAAGPWTQAVGAASLDHDAASHEWDTTGLTNRATHRVKVTRVGDDAVTDVSDDDFALRNGGSGIPFYVNDSSTTNDEWCTATGDDANDGLTPATPKATTQAILSAYNLEPGDIVHIDTGTYNLASDIEIASPDQGSASADVTFLGSSQGAGTTIDRGSTASDRRCVHINRASYIRLERLRLTGAQYGVRIQGAGGDHNKIVNCALYANTTGVHSYYGSSLLIENCSVAANAAIGVSLSHADGSRLKNSIIYADGAGARAVSSESTSLTSDYNNLYAVNDADVGYHQGTPCDTLADWQSAASQDAHSLSVDPLFGDAAGGDFHLQSVRGRWDPAASGGAGDWAIDAQHSPAIDASDPGAAYANEPMPNGGRLNLGAYGNTDRASKSEPDLVVSAGAISVTEGNNQTFTVRLSGPPLSEVTVSITRETGDESLVPSPADLTFGTTDWDELKTVRVAATPDADACDGSATIRVACGVCGNSPVDVTATEDDDEPQSLVVAPLSLTVTEGGNRTFTVKLGCEPCAAGVDVSVASLGPDANLVPSPTELHFGSGDWNTLKTITVTAQQDDDVCGGTAAIRVDSTETPAVDVTASEVEDDTQNLIVQPTSVTVTEGANATFTVALEHRPCGNVTVEVTKESGDVHLHLPSDPTTLVFTPTNWNTPKTVTVEADEDSDNQNGSATIHVTATGCANSPVTVTATEDDNDIPIVQTVTPSQGPDNQATSVVVTGQNFTGATEVELNTLPAATQLTGTISVDGGGTQITGVSVPSGVLPGVYDLIVTTPAGTNTSSAQEFTVYSHLPPVVTGVTPAAGRNDQATQITIAGEHFTGATDVDLDDPSDTALTDVVVNSAGEIVATVPAGVTPGEYNMIVTTPSGSNAISAETFRAYDIGPHTLSVQSTPVTGVSITGTYLEDTDFTESVPGGTEITLVAPWTAGGSYFVRWKDESGSTLCDVASYLFTLYAETTAIAEYSARVTRFYVNDSSTTNDEWCTEPGDDGNDGLTAATPKASVQAVLSSHDLEPGDVVRIDTGTYVLTTDIHMTSEDQGSSTAPVTFEGSPYGVTIDRNDPSSAAEGWHLDHCEYVEITTATSEKYPALEQRWMKITGAYYGIRVYYSHHCTLRRLEVCSNENDGVYAYESDYVTVRNCLVRSNADDGLSLSYCDYNALENLTVVANADDQIYLDYSTDYVTLRNNIVRASGSGDYGIRCSSTGLFAACDYNVLYATDGACVGYYNDEACTTLAEWHRATGKDGHSLSRDPRFLNAAAGDYHLQSTAGSYDRGGWTADGGDSCGIDTGYGDVGAEPRPSSTPLHGANAGMRNLGAYGGTDQGSKTPISRLLWLYEPVGAENYLDQGAPVDVRWTWVGSDWQAGDTAALSYSVDSGSTWNAIDGGGAVDVRDGAFSWDISTVPISPLYRLDLKCNEDGSADDQSQRDFRVGSGVIYYVNDSSVTDDEWCTAPGDDGNDGVTPGTPKATVQSVLETYDLEPGDTVRIDTGAYTLTSDIEVGSHDEGSSAAAVTFEASPYGVTIDRSDPSSSAGAWHLDHCEYVNITTATSEKHPGLEQKWMKITGGYYGIRVYYSDHCTLRRLEVCFNEDDGVYAYQSDYVTFRNGLVHSNTDDGLCLSYCDYNALENLTVVGNTDDQVYLDSSTDYVTFRNNIVWASGLGDYGIRCSYTGLFTACDYNVMHATDGASVGYYNDEAYATLAEWRRATGQDEHSLSRDPRFVNAAAGDYHLQSTAGSYHGGDWTADGDTSCGIDIGLGDAGTEAALNSTPLHGAGLGQRNLGAYGGTEQGSTTPTGRLLWLYEPIGAENYLDQAIPIDVRWTWVGGDWQTTDTARLSYSVDSGSTWHAVNGGEEAAVRDAVFLWDTSALPPSLACRVRLTCNQDAAASAQSQRDFRIGQGVYYYVNDSSTVNDEWCTAPGDDANDGAIPSRPKASVQSVLETYDLEPGDVVCIDTGAYTLTSDIEVTAQDGGSNSAPVTFQGSPYGVTIDRSDPSASARAWLLDHCEYVKITTATSEKYPAAEQKWTRIIGGYYGVRVYYSDHCTLSRLEVCSNENDGVYAHESDYVTVRNCLIHSNGDAGLCLSSCDYDTLENLTVVANAGAQIYLDWSIDSITLRNNIIWASGSGDYAVRCSYTGLFAACDYNVIYATDGACVGYYNDEAYPTLAEWRRATGQDGHSSSRDPRFVNPAAGDYHLQSTTGSYHGGSWTNDAATSCGIDTGLGDAGAEPALNSTPLHGANLGQRNLGAYGGTEQGSKTPTGRLLWLYEPIGAENYLDQGVPVGVRWTWVGSDWQAADTTRLSYSVNSGSTWHAVNGGGEAVVRDGLFSWDISAVSVSPRYRLDLTCNQGEAASDESQRDFRVGRDLTYYVNDSSVTHDEWCTAPGDDGNDGTTPATPKATVQSVLGTYDLEPGDTVRIDTGTYALASDIEVGSHDGGSSAAPVTFEASPYGVTIDRNDQSSSSKRAWELDGCDYVAISTATSDKYPSLVRTWMKVTGGGYGVRIDEAGNCTLSRLEICSNAWDGVNADDSDYLTCRSCLVHANGDDGLELADCDYGSLDGNTVVGNADDQVSFGWSTQYATFRNNLIWADGSGDYGIRCSYTGLFTFSDHNLIYATDGAHVGYYDDASRTTLADWQAATGTDGNSLSADPLLADVAGGDLHVKSTVGRWDPAGGGAGAWVTDVGHSTAIDAGDPSSTFYDEPGPNGKRINIGAYGDTREASKSSQTDADGPQFSGLTFSGSVKSNEQNVVTCTITDGPTGGYGVASATLHYGYTTPLRGQQRLWLRTRREWGRGVDVLHPASGRWQGRGDLAVLPRRLGRQPDAVLYHGGQRWHLLRGDYHRR